MLLLLGSSFGFDINFEAQYVDSVLCTDVCASARDGTCDDQSTCAYGTDCQDCGPRKVCCSRDIAVCKAPGTYEDAQLMREVNHRLGTAAKLKQGLVARRSGSAWRMLSTLARPGAGA